MRERGVCDGVYLCGLRREKERLFYALSNFWKRRQGVCRYVCMQQDNMMHWARRIAASWSGHRPICRRSCVRTRRWSFPCGICCKNGCLHPGSVSNKLESAKRCVITWQRFKRPCRRPPAIPLKGTESKAYMRRCMRGGCDGHGLFQRMERKRF